MMDFGFLSKYSLTVYEGKSEIGLQGYFHGPLRDVALIFALSILRVCLI